MLLSVVLRPQALLVKMLYGSPVLTSQKLFSCFSLEVMFLKNQGLSGTIHGRAQVSPRNSGAHGTRLAREFKIMGPQGPSSPLGPGPMGPGRSKNQQKLCDAAPPCVCIHLRNPLFLREHIFGMAERSIVFHFVNGCPDSALARRQRCRAGGILRNEKPHSASAPLVRLCGPADLRQELPMKLRQEAVWTRGPLDKCPRSARSVGCCWLSTIVSSLITWNTVTRSPGFRTSKVTANPATIDWGEFDTS